MPQILISYHFGCPTLLIMRVMLFQVASNGGAAASAAFHQPRRWVQHDSTMTDSLVGASRVGGGIKVMAIR